MNTFLGQYIFIYIYREIEYVIHTKLKYKVLPQQANSKRFERNKRC